MYINTNNSQRENIHSCRKKEKKNLSHKYIELLAAFKQSQLKKKKKRKDILPGQTF